MRFTWVALLGFIGLPFGACAGAEESPPDAWPRFRGPNGAGISDAKTIPVTWTDRDFNWKIELPGTGAGSPVVWGDRIFLVCADDETARRSVLCLHTGDGRVLWRQEIESKTYRMHRDNDYASSTPAVDALGVVVTWSDPDHLWLMALDPEGRETWRRDLGPFVGVHGSGTSPVIVDDLVVLANEQMDAVKMAPYLPKDWPKDKSGKSFLVAVDRKTGETRWQVPRNTALVSYSTPCLRTAGDGKQELIFTGTAHGITAVDPATGKINWELEGVFLDRCVGSPVTDSGWVFAGYGLGIKGTRYVAVRPGDKPEIVFDVTQSVPLVPTSLVKDGRLFLWGDDGVVTCLEAATGREHWRERVEGSFYASPVCVNDRLYAVAKDGTVVVIAASDRFEVLARNRLGDRSFATPAVAGGAMYLRTEKFLIALGGVRREIKP